MIIDEVTYMTALSGVSATLMGSFIVGAFFYIDSDQHRDLMASDNADVYLRAGVRWIFIAFAMPLFVSLALVSMQPAVGAIVFMVFSLVLIVSTLDTARRILAKGDSGLSRGLLINHWFSTAATAAVVALPWIMGGWPPSPQAYIPSMLLSLLVGFTSTVALVMAQFDATVGMSRRADRGRDATPTD